MLDLRIIAVSALLALGACGQNDRELSRKVHSRLADEGIKEEVKVTSERRVVVLEGVVENRAELNRAELAARNTPGVLGVDNRLVVKPEVGLTGGTPEKTEGVPGEVEQEAPAPPPTTERIKP